MTAHRRYCTINDCNDRHQARGFCKRHYVRYQRHGDPLALRPNGNGHLKIPTSERFWNLVDGSGDCWEWQGTKAGGYGKFSPKHGTLVSAHRWSYEHLIGPIPEGLDLDHLCRVRHCVNPDHLQPVTRRENLHRSPIMNWRRR